MRRFKAIVFGVLIIFSALVIGQASILVAAPSDLDPTFGNAGTVIWSPNNNTTSRAGAAMALQADGKIVMTGGYSETSGVGEFMVVRFDASGSLDTTFGTAGVVIITFAGTLESASSIDIQPDGKIVVLGQTSLSSVGSEFAIARLNTDGSPDTTFSGDGKMTVGFTINGSPSNDYANTLRVMPSGKIVVAGGSGPGPNILYYRTMARLNTDGSLDASFGSGGLITDGLGSGLWSDIVANSDGTMYVGSSASGQFSSNISIRKFSETGSTLWNWGQSVQPGCYMALNALTTQPDGKILAAGSHNCRASILRIDTNGVTDTTFNYGEIQNSMQARAVFVQPDGKVVASFTYQAHNDNGFSLARYNPDGSLDATFGTGGVKRTLIWTGAESAANLVMQPDGKFILGGSAGSTLTSNYRFAMARYIGLSVPRSTPFDFDGDGKSDISVFRPSENKWFVLRSSDFGVTQTIFAVAGDIPTPADFDGDGKTDLAIFRPSNGDWWYLSSINNAQINTHWGANGDIPRPSDFDADGKADFIVFRPAENNWYRRASTGQVSIPSFGAPGDKPLIGDFDGDGKSDPAVFRPSTGDWWYAASSLGGAHRVVHWGANGDLPAPADYDGDGKTDFAVFRPSEGGWYVHRSTNGSYIATTFGLATDRPIPADYDGDGNADIAVYRPSTGVWYLQQTTAGFGGLQWGISTDVAIPNAFVP